MPRSAGTYTPPSSSWYPAVNGASATPADWNALMTDISNALTQSISSDGQTPMTAALNLGNNKITNVTAGTADTDAANVKQLRGPAFSAYPNGNLSVTSGVATKVTANTEFFDTDGCYDTANYRFLPTVAGYYQVNGQIRAVATPLTSLVAAIYKNGSVYNVSEEALVGSGSNAVQQIPVNDLIFMNGTTDYIELYGIATGTNPAFQVASTASTSKFSAFLARRA